MDKESTLKIYGVLGFPAKHSLSPAMHNAAFAALNINAEYRIFEKKPEELDDFLNKLAENNIWGFNITIPYKETMLKYVSIDESRPAVRDIGAVNTVRREPDGKLKGSNTDWMGFSRHLIMLKVDVKGKSAAIIGAGGAARAVCCSLLLGNIASITIYDIDIKKAEKLAADFNKSGSHKIKVVNSIDDLRIIDKDILINASPVGMNPSDPLLIEKNMLRKDMFVYDVIYSPAETKLLSLAKKVGAKTTANGLSMLLYQGAQSFYIWTGKRAPEDIMRKALEEELKRCQK